MHGAGWDGSAQPRCTGSQPAGCPALPAVEGRLCAASPATGTGVALPQRDVHVVCGLVQLDELCPDPGAGWVWQHRGGCAGPSGHGAAPWGSRRQPLGTEHPGKAGRGLRLPSRPAGAAPAAVHFQESVKQNKAAPHGQSPAASWSSPLAPRLPSPRPCRGCCVLSTAGAGGWCGGSVGTALPHVCPAVGPGLRLSHTPGLLWVTHALCPPAPRQRQACKAG